MEPHNPYRRINAGGLKTGLGLSGPELLILFYSLAVAIGCPTFSVCRIYQILAETLRRTSASVRTPHFFDRPCRLPHHGNVPR